MVAALALDLDTPQMVERAQVEAHRHLGAAARRQRGKRIAQTRVGERQSVDIDDDVRLIVTKTLQGGLEPVGVAARPCNQTKRADRRRRTQRQQIGGGL